MVREVFDGVEPQYEVFFNVHDSTTYPEASLVREEEFDSPAGPVELLKRWELGNAEEFRSFMTLAKLSAPIANNLYSFLSSRTELLPYQFKPVLKLIESPYSRMLVADEVGLGKTIEAGIILTELNARTDLRKVLIACPSALLEKWRRELRERFEWDFEIVRGAAFREAIAESGLRSEAPMRMIASLELLRREENLSALIEARPRLDAVIVDEAHHMRNHGTMTNLLGENLSQLTDTMLFLTATPLNLGARDFYELLHLLVPQEFNDFETFQSLIEPNEAINDALRLLRQKSPDFSAALRALRSVEAGSQGERFKRNVRYQETIRALSDGAASERAERAAGCESSTLARGAQHARARVHPDQEARGVRALPCAPRSPSLDRRHARRDGVLRGDHPLGRARIRGYRCAFGFHHRCVAASGGKLHSSDGRKARASR